MDITDSEIQKQVNLLFLSMPEWLAGRNQRGILSQSLVTIILHCEQTSFICSYNYSILGEEVTKPEYNKGMQPFVTVEQMPYFPGGESEMHKFVSQHLKYPIVLEEEAFCSRVTARFVIREDGNVTDIQVVRGCSTVLDKEVVRVIGLMPKWTPGKQNGIAVPVYFTLPVQWCFRTRK